MKPKHVKLYMDIAERCAQESYAQRLKVGAILVKDDDIIGHSWNGTPPGWDNACEDIVAWIDGNPNNSNGPVLKTKPEVLHAEENIISKLAKNGGGVNGSIMFVTHSPCINCSRMMFKAGVKEVYYKNKYRLTDGIDFLEKCGIKVTHVETD